MNIRTHGMMAVDKTHRNRQRVSCTFGFRLLRHLAGLLPFAILGCVAWLTPLKAAAATDTYYFQNVASSNVCGETSTLNQSGEANVVPGGELVSSYGGEVVTNYYHFSWNAGGFGASSLADDMYTAPYASPMTITGLSLRLNYDVTSGYFANGIYPNAYFYAKFYDVDGNAPCPAYEQGTLIAQTPQQNYPPSTTTTAVSGLSYNIQPGHRIRVELWNTHNFTRIAITFKYGAGTTTGLTVTNAPTLADTTTVGPGADIPDTALPPGSAATTLNAFTLQTSTGTDSIKAVRVNLSSPGSASGLGSISVKSDNGSITYGTLTNPTAELLTIPLSTAITATTTPVQYRIAVTPKTTAAMPLPPGGSYAMQGYVYQLDSTYTKVYNDTTSATVTIDNLSPGTPAVNANAGDSSVAFNWTNPVDADFQSVLILRGTTGVTATPVEGSSYTAGGVIGSSKVVYVGNQQTFTDGLVLGDILWNGTPYYYRIFSRDAIGNYSPGVSIGPIIPVQTEPGTAVVGDGINPVNRTVGITNTADLDTFTVTSWPPAHLKGVSFTLSPGISAYNPGVSLCDSAGNQLKYVMATSDTVVFSNLNIPSTGQLITVSNIPSSFTIKVIWNSNLPPPVGSQTPITGSVSAITLDNANVNIAYNDTASATVTVDYAAPENPALQSMTPSDGRVVLGWQNPADTDTRGTLILRNTVPVADAPRSGFSYSPGNTIGSSTVVQRSGSSTPLSAESFTNTGLVNGTSYYYKLFSYDLGVNYSTGLSVGPVTPDVTVTVGNGIDPANTVSVPESGAAALDAFTVTSTSPASISSVTVTLSSGALDVVGSVQITSGDGVTVYGSVANPAAETVTIPTTVLTATVTPADCRIQIIPKPHAKMPAVPGAEVAVSARVTAVTTAASSYKIYNDTTSATLTVDNLSPGNPAGTMALPLDGGFFVSWTNPADADFSRVLVLRDTAAITVQPVEGESYAAGMTIGPSTVVYSGNLQSFFELGLTNGTNYHYRFFSLDSHGNYSIGSPTGPLVPQPNIRTVTGSPTAIMQGLDAIAVTMPFSDDANGNGTCVVDYKLSSASTWSPWINSISRSATRCITTISGLTAGSLYDVRMSYSDSDGVLGTASQTVTGIVALSLVQTTAGVAEATFSDSWIITVTAPFTNDYNRNNSCLIEYKKSSEANWTTWSTLGPTNSPYMALISGLQQVTRYDVRVTYNDPDGVNGASSQTMTGLFSPSSPNPKLMHNSRNANKKGHWAEYGGWGLPGTQYGEFTCLTCHTKRTTNASGIRTYINLYPLGGSDNFGGPVRFDGTGGTYGFGDDSVPRPSAPPINRICEVCHTLTRGGPSQTPEHRKIQPEPANHNPPDCIRCHTHETGFKSPF